MPDSPQNIKSIRLNGNFGHNHILNEDEISSKVHVGDAFDLLDRLPESSIDLVVTSPPYWGQRSYNLEHNWGLFNNIAEMRKMSTKSPGYDWYRKKGGVLGLEPYPEWYVQHLVEIIGKLVRSLKSSGSLWINLGDTYFARWSSIRDGGRQGLDDGSRQRRKTPMGGIRQEKQLLLIPSRFAIAMQEVGWILRNDVIWHKPNATPRPDGDRLKSAHEHFFHFVKKPKEGRAAYYYDISQSEPRQSDVVSVNVAPGEGEHTATFPVELIRPRILTSCPPGGRVLDPFCGTGRTLEVASAHNRIAVGFELCIAFAEVAKTKVDPMTRRPIGSGGASLKGNYVSEWFGQRVYPDVRLEYSQVSGKNAGKCEFLSRVLGNKTNCVKNENSLGVCTVNAGSNGIRQDWLACPYRVIDSDILVLSCEKIFGNKMDGVPMAAPLLAQEESRKLFLADLKKIGRAYVFFQDKLGGEISILGSPQSPEMSFDITVAEIARDGERAVLSRYGIVELQTMDFHGSYKYAVNNLHDGLRLHKSQFPEVLRENLEWAGERVEGPNIANVFKRTFYQMMIKFQLAGRGAAAGTVLALPASVWQSWQPFLGAPRFINEGDGLHSLVGIDAEADRMQNSFICVFDLDSSSPSSISPVKVANFIRVSANTLAHHAFTAVPQHIVTELSSADVILKSLQTRIIDYWPGLLN